MRKSLAPVAVAAASLSLVLSGCSGGGAKAYDNPTKLIQAINDAGVVKCEAEGEPMYPEAGELPEGSSYVVGAGTQVCATEWGGFNVITYAKDSDADVWKPDNVDHMGVIKAKNWVLVAKFYDDRGVTAEQFKTELGHLAGKLNGTLYDPKRT